MGSVDAEEPARKKPTLSPRKREQILKRDGHRCTVPGCRSARNLDVHHIIHQEVGGGHEAWNVTTACRGHHRMHHAGRLSIEGRAPDKLTFTWRRPFEESVGDAHAGTSGVQDARVGTDTADLPTTMRTQAREALVGLGWKAGIARAAVDQALAEIANSPLRIETLIRAALSRCPKPGA